VLILHHEGISEEIFENAANYEPDDVELTKDDLKDPRAFLGNFLTDSGDWDAISFADMVAEILEYSLINHNPDTEILSIHRLVHDWSQNTISEAKRTRECAAAMIAMSVFCGDEVFLIKLLFHLQTLVQKDPQLTHKFPFTWAWIYHASGRFRNASELTLLVWETGHSI
jgi:hypothetical protein